MGFSLSTLSSFTLQNSDILIQKAILGADLMQYVDVRPGFPEATVQINVLSATAGFGAQACGWTSTGSTNFTAISVTNSTYAWKQSLCLADLRQYYLSTYLDSSAFGERLPFEQAIADVAVQETRKYAEQILGTAMISQITTGNGAAAGPTGAWTSSNAYTKAQETVDALPLAVQSREDLMMFMSYASFRALQVDILNQNLYHYNTGQTTGSGLGQSIILPGTNVRVVPVGGLVSSPKVFCGPAKHIIVTTGLVDDQDRVEAWFSRDNQEFRMLSQFTIGLGALAEEFVYTSGA